MVAKPFKTVDQQIEILKSRNLTIADEETIKEILLKENYYNIINGYKTLFLKNTENGKNSREIYLDNSNFNEIYRLHLLDRQLRNIIIKYLLPFETQLKTICSYRFAELFPERNAYLNINCYSQEKNNLETVLKNIANLSRIIQREKGKPSENSIKHYLDKHESVPIWVLINSLTFGEVSYFFNSLGNSLQEKITRDFSETYKKEYDTKIQISVGALKQIIKTVNLFRNICAHEEVFYNRTVKNGKTNLFQNYFEDEMIIDSIRKGNILGLLAILKLVMKSEEYGLLILDVYQPLYFHERLGTFESITMEKIKNKLGFVDNWENRLINFSERFRSIMDILEAEDEDSQIVDFGDIEITYEWEQKDPSEG